MNSVTDQYVDLRADVTKAVLKFCEDHRYPSGGLLAVRNCLEALNRGDVKAAIEVYQRIPLGGRMGYFDDWLPTVTFNSETSEYLRIVFVALLNEWNRVMSLPTGSQ